MESWKAMGANSVRLTVVRLMNSFSLAKIPPLGSEYVHDELDDELEDELEDEQDVTIRGVTSAIEAHIASDVWVVHVQLPVRQEKGISDRLMFEL